MSVGSCPQSGSKAALYNRMHFRQKSRDLVVQIVTKAVLITLPHTYPAEWPKWNNIRRAHIILWEPSVVLVFVISTINPIIVNFMPLQCPTIRERKVQESFQENDYILTAALDDSIKQL
ncbi:hypothetical protein BDC45DRAFT_572925 [Circinella umbellata]|nr:hypothetical protein BDC45DRAFT_572925 [Circinella umbellata]